MNRTCLAVIAVAIFTAQSAAALDGKRKGFFAQLGLGGGYVAANQEWFVLVDKFTLDESAGAGAFGFKIGYGISNRLLLSYAGNVGSADLETMEGQITGLSTKKKTASFGVGGLGLTYFLKEEAPSLFADLTLGMSTWDDGDGADFTGSGVNVGIGYEFKKNWTLEADFSIGKPSDQESLFGEKVLDAEVTGSTLGITVNHIWY